MKIFKSILIFSSLFGFVMAFQSYTNKTTVTGTTTKAGLTWYKVEDIPTLQKQAPKMVIVDVYTDWCKWCKVMDKKTFSNPTLAEHLQENYYMVKFNAEQKSDVLWRGEKFQYIKSGRKGYHSLAAELCNGSLSYPSFVILNENLDIIDVIKGYKTPEQLQSILDNHKV